MIEKSRKQAKERLRAKERGEVRPATEADLRAAYANRRRSPPPTPTFKAVLPWVFVVTHKPRRGS